MRHKTVPCTLPCSVDRFCSFLGLLSIISQTQAELRPRTSQPFSTTDATLPAPGFVKDSLRTLPSSVLAVRDAYLDHQRAEKDHFQRKEYFRPGKFGDNVLLSPMSQGFFPVGASSQQDLALHLDESFQLVGNSPCFRACQLPLRAGALEK